MIVHDEAFEDLAKAPVKVEPNVVVARRVLDEFGDMNDDGIITWQSSDVVMGVTIDSIGEMLGSATKKATVKLLGTDVSDNPLTLPVAGNLFQIRLGLYDNDPSVSGYNYVSEGYYLVDEVDTNYDDGFTTITMYDHMWKAGNTLYTEAVGLDAIDYPVTIYEFAQSIAALLDVTVHSDFTLLPNYDYEITEDLYSTISTATLKNAINDIAGATGSTAHMTDLELHFHPYDVDDETLGSPELKKLKIGDTYGPITSVVLSRQPTNDNIAINASAPADNIVTSVNTSTETLTIVAHGMISGNMIRIESTGTLPAPLSAGNNYYVYRIDDDTFKLAPSS